MEASSSGSGGAAQPDSAPARLHALRAALLRASETEEGASGAVLGRAPQLVSHLWQQALGQHRARTARRHHVL